MPSTYHSLRGRRPTPHRRGDQRMSTSSIQGQLHRSNLPCFAPPLGWAYPTHMSDWLHGIDIFETVAGTAFDVPNSICYLNFNRNRNGCPKKTTQVRTDMTTQSIDSVQDDSVHSAIRNDVQQTTRHFGTAPVHISIAVIILVLACGHYPPQGRTREILTGRSYPVGHPQLNILQTLKQGKGRISRDHTHIPFDNDLTTPTKLQLRSTWDSTVISIAFRMRDVSDNHCSMEGQSNRNFRPSQQHPSNASVPHVSPIKQPELLYMIKTLHSLHNKRTTNISSYGYSNGSSIHNDGGTITGNVTTGITSSNMTQLNRTQGITHSKPNDSLNCSIHLISVSNTDPGENLPGQFIQRNAIFFEVISSEYRKPMSRSNFLDALFGSPAEGTEFQSHVTHMHGPSWIRERVSHFVLEYVLGVNSRVSHNVAYHVTSLYFQGTNGAGTMLGLFRNGFCCIRPWIPCCCGRSINQSYRKSKSTEVSRRHLVSQTVF